MIPVLLQFGSKESAVLVFVLPACRLPAAAFDFSFEHHIYSCFCQQFYSYFSIQQYTGTSSAAAQGGTGTERVNRGEQCLAASSFTDSQSSARGK